MKQGLFQVQRVPSKQNPADIGTKPLDEVAMKECLSRLPLRRRSETAWAAAWAKVVAASLLVAGADAAADRLIVRSSGVPAEYVEHWVSPFAAAQITCVVVLAVVGCIVVCLSKHFECQRRQTAPPTRTSTRAPRKRTKNVAIQGPVTHTRWTSSPRFQPLGDRAWGAWEE